MAETGQTATTRVAASGALPLFGRTLGIAVTFVVMLILVSFAVFLLQYLAPGDVTDALIDKRTRPTEEQIAAIRALYHLDEPLIVQYGYWLRGALTLDFGQSITSGQPVVDVLAARIGLTTKLIALALPMYIFFGIGIGVAAACYRRTTLERLGMAGAVLLYSTPAFVIGLLLSWVFGVGLGWFPVFGPGESPSGDWTHLLLPAIAAATSSMALLAKIVREGMIAELQSDYVTFARARGLPERLVLQKALRNAMIPVVAVTGNQIVGLFTGTILVEKVFALPGLGSLLVDSVGRFDMPVVQGVTVFFCVVVLAINALSDLAYASLDPRLRQTRGAAP